MTKTMPQQTILFDLDDTLVHCNKYFDMVIRQFLDTMTTWFKAWNLQDKEIKTVQSEFDISRIQKNGFHSEHFPRSFIDTYEHFCNLTGKAPSEEEKSHLWSLGFSVYDMEIDPYPGMVDTLEMMREAGHALYLYTGGEPIIQHRKIEQMKLATYFGDRIFIRQHKTTEALAAIIAEQSFCPAKTWMVGNSVRTDVLPGLQAGLHVIYLQRPDEWHYNLIDIDIEPQGAFYTIEKLVDVPRVIQEWLVSSTEAT